MRRIALFTILFLFLGNFVLAQDPTQEVLRTEIALGESGFQAQVSAIPIDTEEGPVHFNDCLDIVLDGEIVASRCYPPTANVQLEWLGTRPRADYIHVIYFARGNQELSAPSTEGFGEFFGDLGNTLGDIWNEPQEYASPAIDQLCYFNKQSENLTCEAYLGITLPFPPDQ